MNNKGFTLIELLVTISLLAIIIGIGTVSISKVINQNKINNCEALVNNINTAVADYISDNRYNSLVISNTENKIILLSTLISNNYLSGDVYDPFNNSTKLNDDDVKIEVSLKSNYTIKTVTIKNSSGNVIDCASGSWN